MENAALLRDVSRLATKGMTMFTASKNTARELWREREDDYYAPSLFVTEGGGIGMNIGGIVIVKPIREWFALADPAKQRKPK